MTLKFDGLPWKAIGHLFYTTSSFVHSLKSIGEFKLELVWKRSIWVKIDFLSETFKSDGWPAGKTIGHLLYTTSSFVHHLKAMGEFKLELQSGNAQLESKSAIFLWPWNLTDDLEQGKSEGFDSCDRPSKSYPNWIKIVDFSAHVTLKFDGWPRKIMGTSSILHQMINSGWNCQPWPSRSQNWMFVHSIIILSRSQQFPTSSSQSQVELGEWETGHFMHCIKLCASFKIHQWFQTGVTVWKPSVQVKINDFLSHVTFKFDRWPWKTKGHVFYATSSILHHFVAVGEFKLELQSGNAQFGSNLTIV